MFSPPPEQCFVSLKSEGTAQFHSLAPLSPHLCHSYIQSHIFESNFPCNNKAFAKRVGGRACVLVLPVGMRMCQGVLR